MEGEAKKEKKLTYEQLKACYDQAVVQTHKYYEESQKLRQVISEMREQMNYNDISIAFKILEHSKFFSEDFIKKIVAKLETILDPKQEQSKEEPKEE